ncbi:sel1 repeat family protein [Pelomyxa schiedti]|nr:sel1 repeat family protein [Pelomyxa schiedti]
MITFEDPALLQQTIPLTGFTALLGVRTFPILFMVLDTPLLEQVLHHSFILLVMGNTPTTTTTTTLPTQTLPGVVVGYDEFQRAIRDRDAFFLRLGQLATQSRNDVQDSSESIVVSTNFRLVGCISHGCSGIVYEVKCIGEGHPVLFRDQSYVLKALFNYGLLTTASVQNASQSEYVVASTLEPHPNINRYFCHFVDRIPVEYYNHLPPVPKEFAFDKVKKRMHACVWVVLEHHSETLGQFLTHIKTTAPKLGPCTTPWPIVHKYSRDICAALVHLFVNQTIHFDIKLDNILVSSNKEQVILIDFGCATKIPKTTTSRAFEATMESVISATGNPSHRAPEIINRIAQYWQNPDQSSTLCCDKQPSFELGCILFELAMCGKHPLPRYPGGYGPSGKVTFSFESEELFPMKPPQFPKEFCDLVRSLLQFDPAKRMPLLDAFEVLLNIDSPSPSELLSFYSCVPLTNDAGALTIKATCQILCGSSTGDCVETLHKALQLDPFFSPALMLLHYLSPCQQQTTDNCTCYAVQASLRGKTASFTPTDVEFTRAVINKKHRNTLPELVLTALWTRHISCDAETFSNALFLLLKKSPTATRILDQEHQQPGAQVVIFLRSVIYTRNEMMMEALLKLQVGNIDSALALVANAFSLFQSEMNSESPHHDREYLPGLLFLVCLSCVISDHESLHQHIPTCLSLAFSRAISFSTMEMRAHCISMLNETNQTSEKQEWTDLVSTATGSALTACMYFVALWKLYCCPSTVTDNQRSVVHIFVDMSAKMPAPTSGDERSRSAPTVGEIHWCVSSVTSLGLCYDAGVGGVEKDNRKAVELYQRAADAGDTTAMYNLAVCYDNGDGVEKDTQKAVTLYQRAADAGNTSAMCNLGVGYENGYGKDIKKTVTLYKRAADAGHATAMYNLAVCYEHGIGVDTDIGMAVTLWQRAADAGDSDAMFCLGVCYENGDALRKDIHKAVILYQKAADAGNAKAMYWLGVCYENGTGVEKDIQKAVSLFQRAVDSGYYAAMLRLGFCYQNGNGVDRDINKAVTLWQSAADAGETDAMYVLGWCYASGAGVDKDIHNTVTLWQRAADAGNANATRNLAMCYDSGYGVDQDIHKAVSLYKRAADAGDAMAMHNLAQHVVGAQPPPPPQQQPQPHAFTRPQGF